jgi:hypothetical protein
MVETDVGGNPENIKCDNQFNNQEFVDYFTSKGTRLCLVQPTGATIQERNHRKMVENFGFAP